MDQQRDIICGSTVHQPQEFGESKDAQIADLRQRLKALSQSKKEEERNWIKLLVEKDIAIRILTSLHLELQEKESTIQIKLRMLEVEKEDDTKTIQQLRCSNSELEIENAKLHEQVQELSVQLATQPYRTPTQLQPQVGMQVEQQPTTQQEQIPHKQQPKQKKKLYVKKDPTSMIKNLKAKERKEKQHDPEFQYPKVTKVTRASKQAAKQVEQSTKDKKVLDADAYILPQPINITKSWVFPQTLPISRLIKDHIKDILQHISNVSGLEALIWTSELNIITFEDIGNLIKQKEIANNNFINMTENQSFRVSLFDKHIETAWRNYRFLHFPINTGGNEKSTHGNHWTLLVLDKQDNLWRFYNSLRPRRDDAEDKYVKDAKQLQDYVENFLKACLERDAQSQPSFKLINSQNTSYDFEYVNNAPQQESDSLDCGLFVCYIMKQYSKHEPIKSKLSTQEIRLMRAELIERFVTEVGRSWTEPIEIPPEEPQIPADITIGSISEHDLRTFLRWAATHLGYASLAEIEAAPPTAELEPIQSNYSQNFCYKWGAKLTPSEVADKVKHYGKISGRSRGLGFVTRSKAGPLVEYERRIAANDLVDGDSSQVILQSIHSSCLIIRFKGKASSLRFRQRWRGSPTGLVVFGHHGSFGYGGREEKGEEQEREANRSSLAMVEEKRKVKNGGPDA
ncbi:hypothetical protein TEA_014142 [Camellia sinensis var. sinensis]|uniref:Ubiquitin-like protease family profile domain-containing protein n=1 Tax=Camellia sinensis var. sinensis TaxID=542762 RepID=A0A4S4DIZ5_CAMSN|nr:hypothetical protein TEA_014142 [Camellia sinensis var. sinensis]